MNLVDTIENLKSEGYILVGSRSVFPNEDLVEGTDYDFMHTDTPDNRKFLIENDFCLCIEVGETSAYFDGKCDTSSTAIWKLEGLPIEVVLKVPDKFEDLKKFWRLMQKNPEAFKTKFWKSYEVLPEIEGSPSTKPNTKEKIASEMVYFLNHIIPYVEV